MSKSLDEDHLASALHSKSSFGGSAEWAKPFEFAAAARLRAGMLNELHVLTY